MSERKNGKGWLLAIVAVVLLGAGWLWLSGALSPWSFTRSVTVEPQGYFFRVKASYTHGDEKVDFDYVAVCGFRTTRYKDGDKSMDGIYAPRVVIKATSDGGALLIRTPRACHGETTANRKAPYDLLPLVFWFDDVNDLTYGLGYATPDAYDSPIAQVKFHGATIEAATAEDWQVWRDKAEAEYKQKGMLPGPWGYSYGGSSRFAGGPTYDPEKRMIARVCYGYVRLELPEQVRPRVRELWPPDRPRYWPAPADKTVHYEFWLSADGKVHRVDYGNGRTARSYLNAHDQGEVGVPTRAGTGTISALARRYPADTFPILPRSRSLTPPPLQALDSYPKRIVVREDMKGFVACGGDEAVDYIENFDKSFRSKKHPLYINDEVVSENVNPLLLPFAIYEQDKYAFVRQWWGN